MRKHYWWLKKKFDTTVMKYQWYQVFTQEVPDEDVLKESWRLEAVLEHLLQGPHQSVLSTQEEGQAASLRWAATEGKADMR